MNKPKCTDITWTGHADCKHCSVRGMVLFADLQEADIDHILLPIDQFVLPAQTHIYEIGGPHPYLYTIRRGLVKLQHYLPGGAPRIVRLLRSGDLAGLEALINGAYHHTAVTMQETEICRIPIDVIRQLNQDRPRLTRQILKRWLSSLDEADDFIALLSTGKTRARVARLLLFMAGNGSTCSLPSREDMGNILGIRLESASRTIAEFRRAGILTERAGLCRLDLERLREIAADYP